MIHAKNSFQKNNKWVLGNLQIKIQVKRSPKIAKQIFLELSWDPNHQVILICKISQQQQSKYKFEKDMKAAPKSEVGKIK